MRHEIHCFLQGQFMGLLFSETLIEITTAELFWSIELRIGWNFQNAKRNARNSSLRLFFFPQKSSWETICHAEENLSSVRPKLNMQINKPAFKRERKRVTGKLITVRWKTVIFRKLAKILLSVLKLVSLGFFVRMLLLQWRVLSNVTNDGPMKWNRINVVVFSPQVHVAMHRSCTDVKPLNLPWKRK